jgi:hypothetical protein
MPLNMVSMAIYVTLEGKIPRTPYSPYLKAYKGGLLLQSMANYEVNNPLNLI